ncbi:MAG: monovalent cation/H(+) antiporter subunit G [Anaerosomatales bacterium]|jgi:multicomponent Na+:H+ antiporter subunit G|nr:monovalent cation/H(+) antiporter subunit G [Anaerosomatales bacterium]
MSVASFAAGACFAASAFFFVAGTVGLLRFPDVYTRLHALTKADNLGIGFLVLALAIRSSDPVTIAKLVLIWLAVLVSSATASNLIAAAAYQDGAPWWRNEQ